MLHSIQKHIQQNLQKWLISISTGLFLFVVLFVYQGYRIQTGDSYSGHSLLFRSISFGLSASFIFGVNEFFVSKWINTKTYFEKSLWLFWEVFSGANICFLFFNYFWNWKELYWNGYFLMLFEYTLVMVFPLSFSILLSPKIEQLWKAEENNIILFESENGKHKLQIKTDNLLYIKSEDNYVEIFYVSDQKVKCELQRNTLKNIEQQYAKSPFLERCHRSYIINPSKINQVIKSNRQIQLDLGFSKTVPVSPKYQPKFEV